MIKKIFNKRTLIKIVSIFSFGLISRIIINNYFGINVFTDFFSNISICYYLILATFITFVHDYADNLRFTNLSPCFISDSSRSKNYNKKSFYSRIASENSDSNTSNSNSKRNSPKQLLFDMNFDEFNREAEFNDNIRSQYAPSTPRESNLTTPSTMTPLFPSTDNFGNNNIPYTTNNNNNNNNTISSIYDYYSNYTSDPQYSNVARAGSYSPANSVYANAQVNQYSYVANNYIPTNTTVGEIVRHTRYDSPAYGEIRPSNPGSPAFGEIRDSDSNISLRS